MFAFLLLVGLVIPFLVPRHAPEEIFEWLPRSVAQRAERSLGIARTAAEGPPMVWLRFDDESLNAELAPATPRAPIADLLERLLGEAGASPKLVFLDIAVTEPGRDPVGDARLQNAVREWNRTPAAAPLAIYAGRGCSAPGQPITGGDADPTIPFDPGAFGEALPLRPTHTAARKARVTWSCPTFIGLRQTEYSCVTTPPTATAPNRTYKWALPSPAWFAASVRSSPTEFGAHMLQNLESADEVCRGLDPAESGISRPHLSRLNLAYSDLGGADGLARRTVAGGKRPLLSIISMSKLRDRPDSDLSALNGAIVVIGTGNSWFPDRIHTEAGEIPGGVVVAAALREALLFGLSEPMAAATQSLMIVVGFALAALIFRILVPGLRRRVMASERIRRPLLAFLILHEQTIVLLLLVFLFWMPGLFPAQFTLVVVVVAFLTELMLLADFMGEDWKREQVAG